uniref:Replicative DNA helicase n=1 Tax=Cyanidiococcus yangmingshanensis TaxID=2690220 RepID=A0A7G5VUG3_9RHOD|nr:DNA replication helicase [Cyanidiococcus yangmingshanensis]QMX77330.1 DNA replication helicase [Cyanidiococcus yangmingshanensis]
MMKQHISGAIVAEELLLACVILDKQSLDFVCLDITPNMFLIPKHQILYQHMYQLYKKGIEINVNNLYISLAETDSLEIVGGHESLTQLSLATKAPYQTLTYIEWVKNAYLRRSMQQLALRFLGASLDVKQSIEQVLTQAENALVTLLSQQAPPMTSLAQTLDMIQKQMLNQMENPTSTGYLTGYRDLDRLTQGLQKQDMIVVAARPSVGKTAFALNLAKRVSREGKAILIFSLEMDKTQLGYRLLSLETKLSNAELKSAYSLQEHQSKLENAINNLKQCAIFLQDSPSMTIDLIRAQAKRKFYEHGELGLIVLDYVQMLGDENQLNRVQALSNITRHLKALARELNVPVVVLSQLSRNLEYRVNKKPLLSDLRESGSIEQDADLVLFLHKDLQLSSSQIEMILAKHRNGPCGQFYLMFHAPSNTFSDARNEI